jgi:SAM-dependent methyltransferase
VHNFVLWHAAIISYSWAVACAATPPNAEQQVSKRRVAGFWNSEPCGSRYLGETSEFERHAKARYELEPHIPNFARFACSRGLRVLEIGVGIGADYEQWLKAGAIAAGVDLSVASLERARQRCELAGLKSDLRVADAEDLPFSKDSFDVVYSYGVMHHSPDTAKCLQEAWRVLKPGGEARIMLYHHRSLTGLMLWLRYGIWRGQTIRRCVLERLESPGTKTFSADEVCAMMRAFENVRIELVFSPGDLLLSQPSRRFQGLAYRAIWKFFPRALIRRVGARWALFLLVTAKKPGNAPL